MARFVLPFFIICFAFSLNACSNSGPQSLQNGLVYWIDNKCEKYEFEEESTDISCYDAKGQLTGKRSPMNQAEIEQYYYNQQQENYQLNQSIERNRPRIRSCSGTRFNINCFSL